MTWQAELLDFTCDPGWARTHSQASCNISVFTCIIIIIIIITINIIIIIILFLQKSLIIKSVRLRTNINCPTRLRQDLMPSQAPLLVKQRAPNGGEGERRGGKGVTSRHAVATGHYANLTCAVFALRFVCLFIISSPYQQHNPMPFIKWRWGGKSNLTFLGLSWTPIMSECLEKRTQLIIGIGSAKRCQQLMRSYVCNGTTSRRMSAQPLETWDKTRSSQMWPWRVRMVSRWRLTR